MRRSNSHSLGDGFTLVELLVVMAIIGLLASIAAPRYFQHLDQSREAVLRQQLAGVRDAIDKYYGVHERYPANLQALVDERYLRSIPVDPLTDRDDTWQVVQDGRQGGVFDIHSGAEGAGSNGKSYASW